MVTSLSELRRTQPSSLGSKKVEVTGIVISTDEKGFTVQTPDSAAERAGIFVYAEQGYSVKPGDEVQLQAQLAEYRSPDADETGRAKTQLHAAPGDVKVLSENNPLPSAIELASAHALGLDKFEGQRAVLKDVVVVGAPYHHVPGKTLDMYVLPDESKASKKGRTPAGGIARGADPSLKPMAIKLPLEGFEKLPFDVGTRFKTDLVGHIENRKGQNVFQVDGKVTVEDITFSNLQPEVSTLMSKYDPKKTFFVGSLNVENLDIKVEDINKVAERNRFNVDDDVGDGKQAGTARKIVVNMGAPPVVGLNEMHDNDGGEISKVVDADENFESLIQAIQDAGGPLYKYVQINPTNNAWGGMPGANIRNGFLYNPEVVSLKGKPELLDGPEFEGSRRPLIATFEFKVGDRVEEFTVMSVHAKSKAGGAEKSDEARIKSAKAINAWAGKNQPKDAHHHLVVVGDHNAYSGEKPMIAQMANGYLRDLALDLPETERTTSSFSGIEGDLDHALVDAKTQAELDIVDIAAQFDARFRDGDHDALVVAIPLEEERRKAS
jgi:predicted extracellular nuclease